MERPKTVKEVVADLQAKGQRVTVRTHRKAQLQRSPSSPLGKGMD